MKPYLNILVGINYTDSSRHALKEAQRIASQNGAKVTACHVVPMGDLDEFVDFYMIEHEIMITAALSSLEGFVEEVLGKDHDLVVRIAEGVPHHELVSIANEEGHDLLVLGDDDYASESRKSGQFAIKCLRFATMPVLLINRPITQEEGTIAACIDFSDTTTTILEHANRMSSGCPKPMQIIHAYTPPWLRPLRLRYHTRVSETANQKTQYREFLNGRLATLCDQARSSYSGEIDPVLIEHEDPSDALIDHLQTLNYSLAIVGRTGKGIKGIFSDLLGGTAESIIRKTTSPVLVVPANK